jgi:hypothetical protein
MATGSNINMTKLKKMNFTDLFNRINNDFTSIQIDIGRIQEIPSS